MVTNTRIDEVLLAARALRANGRNATPEAIATTLGRTLDDIATPLALLVIEMQLRELAADTEWLGDPAPTTVIVHYVPTKAPKWWKRWDQSALRALSRRLIRGSGKDEA